ncbi:MAG: TIGR02466 family protein [Verrucomicrobiales bacterium]
MPIDAWFPTFIYSEPLISKGGDKFNAELLKEVYQIRDYDVEGQEWSASNYRGGYTSYGSMAQLHKVSSTFAQLEQKINAHVKKFAAHLDMDLRKRRFEMSDCWINIMPEQAVHSLHLHPLSFISGSYYVQTPSGCSTIKFEDPRLSKFMAAPPKLPKTAPHNKQFVGYPVEAGKVILFESWLRHEVAANPSAEDRISISFNYHWL